MKQFLVTCEAGHQFQIDDVTEEPEVIACISYCPIDIPKPEHGGLFLACGARVVLIRNPKAAKPRKFKFKKGVDKKVDTD